MGDVSTALLKMDETDRQHSHNLCFPLCDGESNKQQVLWLTFTATSCC